VTIYDVEIGALSGGPAGSGRFRGSVVLAAVESLLPR